MEHDITGNYPIIIDGTTAGEITVKKDGLFWVFDAKCELRDDIIRLSVFGDGQEGYLGVMEPNGDVLKLSKKLSKTAIRTFPQIITYGGRKGEGINVPQQINNGTSEYQYSANVDSESPPDCEDINNNSVNIPPDENKPPTARHKSPPNFSELLWRPCPCPCSLFYGIEEKSICGYISGAFAANEGERIYLAVPENVVKDYPYNQVLKFLYQIEFFSELYKVCIIENGKCISEL